MKQVFSEFKLFVRLIIQLPSQIHNSILSRLHGVSRQSGCKMIGSISIINKGKISLGEKCNLDGRRSRIGFDQPILLTTQKNGEIRIGNHVGLSNCALYATKYIEIGEETLIGGGVKIYDTNFHSTNWRFRNTPEDKAHTASASVIIGKHCFIGAGTIILKGVQVGNNSIVAAGSVVTHSIPENEVWGGNPAHKIKTIE